MENKCVSQKSATCSLILLGVATIMYMLSFSDFNYIMNINFAINNGENISQSAEMTGVQLESPSLMNNSYKVKEPNNTQILSSQSVTRTFKDPSKLTKSSKLVSFLDSAPEDILRHTSSLDYLPGYKNPCFHLNVETFISSQTMKNFSKEKKSNYYNDRAYPNHSQPWSGNVTLCLPSVFLVGIRKSGTTDLARKLMLHQDVYNGIKEAHFFDKLLLGGSRYTLLQYVSMLKLAISVRQKKWYKFENDLGTWQSLQDTNATHSYGQEKLLGDFTPAYAFRMRCMSFVDREITFDIPIQIQHLVPNAKVMFILRNPTNRAGSSVRFFLKQYPKLFPVVLKRCKISNESRLLLECFHLGFVEAISWWKNCTKEFGENSIQCSHCDYLRKEHPVKSAFVKSLVHGIYHTFIDKYAKVFPRKNILLISMDRYSNNSWSYIENEVLPFLRLKPYDRHIRRNSIWNLNVKKNQNNLYSFDLLPKTEALLNNFYSKHNEKLASYFSDASLW